tara:strand:- start:43 stop:594 length:552 start_codon:yes stop_codon:yes gene_type:complete
MTREQWLNTAAESLRGDFNAIGEDFGAPRISIGFTGSRSGLKALGAAWHKDVSTDNTCEIFIAPHVQTQEDILAVLVHELVHACGYMDHGKNFRRVAIGVGLTGKMTSTVATDALKERLNALILQIGQFPGAALNPTSPAKKQGTRMIKMECEDCGFIARASGSAIMQAGLPTCGCGGIIEIA